LSGWLGGHFYTRHVIEALPRSVQIRISIDSTNKPNSTDTGVPSWNTSDIEHRLKQTLRSCWTTLKTGQSVHIELVEEAAAPAQIGWTVESGLRTEYNGRVRFTKGALPFGGLAMSDGEGNTTISKTKTAEHVAGLPPSGTVVNDIFWSNYMAHEMFWLNVAEKHDNKLAPENDIANPNIKASRPIDICPQSCRSLIRAMDLRQR